MFGKKKNIETPVAATETVRTFSPTKKRKNTYVIRTTGVWPDPQIFSACKQTPLVVDTKNGDKMATYGWQPATMFPNPGAVALATEYKDLSPIMGQTAATIIEYLDCKTGRPVLYLFPTAAYICNDYKEDYESHLNHATRRDLQYQIKLREQLIDQYNRSVRS